jgi:hypothetical protein
MGIGARNAQVYLKQTIGGELWRLRNLAKPGQAKPGQAKPGQAKPGQAKLGQAKPGQEGL